MDIQALIAAKQKEMSAKKARQSTLKPAEGNHSYRIMPSWRGGEDKQFWHDFGMHFVKNQESGDKPAAVYLCTEKTYGKPCSVCDGIRKYMQMSGDDKLTEMLKKAGSTQRYLLNVLHLSGPEPTKVQIMEVGQGVFDDICAMIGEFGDITDPNSGIDFKIKREGSGLDTKYTVMPSAKSEPVPKAALNNLPNLDEFVAQENPAGEAKAIAAVAKIIGISGPAAAPAVGSSRAAAIPDLSEAEEADFAPVGKPTSSAGDLDLSDLDDLDALLEG